METFTNCPVTRREALKQFTAGLAGVAGWSLLGESLFGQSAAQPAGADTQPASAGAGSASGPAGRPNIVFVLTDDQRWDLLGCVNPLLKTPHLDRLAREGARFQNAFVTTSLCSPSRGSFLTGCYAHTHGVLGNSARDLNARRTPTFPLLLQQAGYRTAFLGKWHMGRKDDPRPGFDYWLSFSGQGKYQGNTFNENGKAVTDDGYITDVLTDKAVAWLQANGQAGGKPFCLILAHKALHDPFAPAARHKDLYADIKIPAPPNFNDSLKGKPRWQRQAQVMGKKWPADKAPTKPVPDELPPRPFEPPPRQREMYRALAAVDESLGRVLKTLEDLKQLDNTLVVFAGDNGYFYGEHRLDDKRLAYEEALRIPFLMRYPKLIKPGSIVAQMALNIDLAPTLLEAAGVPRPNTIQGASLLPLLAGKAAGWRTSFMYEYWVESNPGIPRMAGVRTERWKYVEYPDLKDEIPELYDLQADPGELKNLAQDPKHADTLKEMRAELTRLKKEFREHDKE